MLKTTTNMLINILLSTATYSFAGMYTTEKKITLNNFSYDFDINNLNSVGKIVLNNSFKELLKIKFGTHIFNGFFIRCEFKKFILTELNIQMFSKHDYLISILLDNSESSSPEIEIHNIMHYLLLHDMGNLSI